MDSTAISKYNNKTHPTFSFFYDIVKEADDKQKTVSELWKKIYGLFATIEEWYNDEDLYHYVGYLSVVKSNSTEDMVIHYLEQYKKFAGKNDFINNCLKKDIRRSVSNCSDLDFVYEAENPDGKSKSKTVTRPVLLLHNVQTVINQNACISSEKKYDIPDFIRFPFHLFKKEKWDVEHIRPNNLQDFQGDRKKNEIKKYIFVLKSSEDRKIQSALEKYNTSARDAEAFESLWESINNQTSNNELKDDQKNKIWNYVLLDSSTNREYGNACFSIKRDYVIKKERGIKPRLSVDKAGEVFLSMDSEAAFVPICTRKVFSKEYTQYPENMSYWTEKDAAYYRMDIEKTLWWYLKNDEDPDKFPEKLFDQYASSIIKKKNYEKSFSDFLKEVARA